MVTWFDRIELGTNCRKCVAFEEFQIKEKFSSKILMSLVGYVAVDAPQKL